MCCIYALHICGIYVGIYVDIYDDIYVTYMYVPYGTCVLKYLFGYFQLVITLIIIKYFYTPKNELNANNVVK